MTRTAFFLSLLLPGALSTNAQDQQDIKSIQSLCGCYEVEFRYKETFSPDAGYKLKDQYVAKGLEWGGLVESADKKIIIQRILVIDDSMVVKHWREDWTYQNTDLLQYSHDDVWKKAHLPADNIKGQWSQSVWEVMMRRVTRAPRYGYTRTERISGKAPQTHRCHAASIPSAATTT